MTVAVNTRFLRTDYLEGFGYFVCETFKRITKNHPEHEFIFIFDRPYDHRFVFNSNVTSVVAGPAARHPLLWKFWFDVKVPSVLKKYKADVFVSCDGFCSLTTKVPQCLVAHDLAFIHFPGFIKKSHLAYYKRNTPKFLKKAKSLVTVSEFSKKDIITHYKIESNNIDIVYNAAKEIFKPLNADQKQLIKNKYTDGKEYFVYAGAIHPRKNLINLLKAFSIFKKRQQSSLKLLLVGRLAWKYESFIRNLRTFKYRNDVVMTGYVEEEELTKLVGAAYALVYPSLYEGFGVPVLEAIQCNVPVITSINSAMQEVAQEAALYINPGDYNDIADKMMVIYKDENLRNELIKKGQRVAKEYNWEKSAELFWQSILKAVN